jgi:predicted dithiol-disulfide oxidoreductase (DUF899 family)
MSAPLHLEHLHFPNESADYRAARNALLEEEMALRRKIERLAVLRRALPPGGELKGAKSNPQYFQLCGGKTSSDK